jgi:hypothetical protein
MDFFNGFRQTSRNTHVVRQSKELRGHLEHSSLSRVLAIKHFHNPVFTMMWAEIVWLSPGVWIFSVTGFSHFWGTPTFKLNWCLKGKVTGGRGWQPVYVQWRVLQGSFAKLTSFTDQSRGLARQNALNLYSQSSWFEYLSRYWAFVSRSGWTSG